jgi:exopolyphosphatase/guanosine-5'-triphosphate,3'-diphosphate pyrophosphatase
MSKDPLNAAIDIGTNSCKLLIGKTTPDGSVVHVDFTIRRTRLGEGSFDDHLLKPVPVQRTVDAIKEFVARGRARSVEVFRAVSTQALRQATNSTQVVDQIYRDTGLRVEVISGEVEAQLTLIGVACDFADTNGLLVINSGGGSTEYAAMIEGITSLKYLPVGALSLTTRYIAHDPPNRTELLDIKRAVADELRSLDSLHMHRKALCEVVAVGGSAVTLAQVAQGDTQGSVATAHRYRLENRKLQELADVFAECDRTKRAGLPGMDIERIDTILAGATILLESLAYFDKTSVYVSTRSISDGILKQLSQAHIA